MTERNPVPASAKAVFPVVGIGASAGGLEAISRLLTCLPLDTGMAIVVVQHMDPSRESLMPQILQNTTELPVAQAKNGTVVRPNRVYIIPPNTHMRIHGNHLKLVPRPEGVHAMSVNCFLYSLAEQRGNKAIAVILSGTADDGALGVKAIKEEGGVVFAQDESSSGFFGMPESAAATGVVDFILPPEKIAAELVSISQHPVLGPKSGFAFDDPRSLAAIFLRLRRTTGVDFSLYKSSTVERRLLRRLMLHKIERLDQYAKMVGKDDDEVRALHDDILIHVTHFFREPKAVAALRAKAFPRLLKGLPADATIRAWVAGCSTGEEAYTLAISLLDFLGERDVDNPIQVFATDISETALERARAGEYSSDIVHHVPPRLLRRFFTKTDRGYQIAKRVRDACVFARQDLTKDPPFANVDIVSCCNVLIYLSQPAQKKIFPMFHYALRPYGSMILSHSETVGEFGDLFATADRKSKLYYKKPSSARLPLPFPLPARGGVPALAAPKAATAEPNGWPETDVQKVAERILLARYAPAGAVISGDFTVLNFRGRVARYLEPSTGKANLNLLKMLPAHVAGKLSKAVATAKRTDVPGRIERVAFADADGGRDRLVTIEVLPFRIPISGERYFIVVFEDSAKAGKSPTVSQTRPAEVASVRRLKAELESVRGYMQTVTEEHEASNEELKAANEEITASNEELQSTNEEMEIAKEELQAANEELTTVNEELNSRNADLGQVNDDLLNLIASVNLPIVMVSADLRIRRFSAKAAKLMNLLPGDIGRPIGDIKPKIELPDIEDLIHEVIESATPRDMAVGGPQGGSWSLRVQPYKTIDNKIEGAVLVFLDPPPTSAA